MGNYEKIRFTEDDFKGIRRVHIGGSCWVFRTNLADSPALSDDDVNNYVEIFKPDDDVKKYVEFFNNAYAGDLSFWISIFMRGREGKTGAYANMIIKYLFIHGYTETPHNTFVNVPLPVLNRALVTKIGVGGKIINEGKIPKRQRLEELLKAMVEDDLIVEEKIVIPSPRSKPNKEKPTLHYRINQRKMHFTKLHEHIDKLIMEPKEKPKDGETPLKPSYKILYNDLRLKANNTIASCNKRYTQLGSFNGYNIIKLDVAIEMLKELGIAEPHEEIMDRIKKRDPISYEFMSNYNPRQYKNILDDEVYRDFRGR